MRSFISIGNNKGRGIGVMVRMVTNYKKKKFTSTDNQNKEKTVQNSNVIYLTCGKKHMGRSCYKETGACFSCGT